MIFAKSLEYRITQKMIARNPAGGELRPGRDMAELAIKVLATTVLVAIVGMQFPELVWAGLAASVVYVSGTG